MFDTGTRMVPWTIAPPGLHALSHAVRRFDVGLGDRPSWTGSLVASIKSIESQAWVSSKRRRRTLRRRSGHALCEPGQIAGPPTTATARRAALSIFHANAVFVHGAGRVRDHRPPLQRGHAASRNVCNVVPDQGMSGARCVEPHSGATPMKSTVWIRMNSREQRFVCRRCFRDRGHPRNQLIADGSCHQHCPM